MTSRSSKSLKIVLALFFIVSVICPLISMFSTISPESVQKVFASASFSRAVKNSLVVSAVSTLVSVSLALLLAFCIARSHIRCKGLFQVVLTFPMLIPSISHGMGLIILLGANGIITRLLHLSSNIYGFGGIVIGSVMYSFPVAFLMLSDVLRYEDGSHYEAARVLGIPKINQFFSLTLPYLSKSMISVVFAIFTMIITDYGVPLMIGGNYTTLPVMMYQDVVGLLDFGKGSVVGALLLLPAVAAFIIDLLKESNSNASVTKPVEITVNPWRDAVSYFFCILVSVLVLFPILTFILLTFVTRYPLNMEPTLAHIVKVFSMKGGVYFRNSVLISVFVSVIGSAAAYLTAYCTVRVPTRFSKFLHLISITSLAIPGIVLGLAYILFFKSSFLYGTLGILILVNMIHFFASPYLMVYNTFNIINHDLENVGATLGINRLRIFFHVLLPQTKGTLIEMITYFFVNSMMTISAVSFLSTVNTKPIALMINQFEANRLLECSAFVSLLILMMNLLLKGLAFLAKRLVSRAS